MSNNRIVPVLYAESLKEIVPFYTDVLGFSVDTLVPGPEDPELAILDLGPATLMYNKTGPMPKSNCQINIEVKDVFAVLETFPQGIKPEWGPEAYDYGRTEFAVRDPNNILVVFSMPNEEQPVAKSE